MKMFLHNKSSRNLHNHNKAMGKQWWVQDFPNQGEGMPIKTYYLARPLPKNA